MNNDDARDRLNLARQSQRRAARSGALATVVGTAVFLVAVTAVVDLDMLWLLGLVMLGFVALSLARPVRLRLNWSDRLGVALLATSIVAVIAAYVLAQALLRSLDWTAPNTLSALVAGVVLFAACTPALVRLATRSTPTDGQVQLNNA